MYFIWNHRGFICTIHVYSDPKLLCIILAWLSSSYWFFRIIELSDVHVNDNDLDIFNQNYCRTHWPYYGMACEVKDCGSYIYPTLPKYMRHWHRIHKEHHDLLVCPRCTQNFEKLFFSHQTYSKRPSSIIGCKQRNGSESFSY